MKSVCVSLLLFIVCVALPGCGGSDGNTLATDGATADDFAQYEADLAAVTGAEANEDTGEENSE
ncbi:hypothetical protein FYK55_27925 [Roseiconus nitratireducens]|uniref:Secreted protein n=1 Tax=Roseiconus nitratireducens TaxID=2605748 RepID=A0A5M6CS08_9BACT|nr:hypothetical protein [Roseiconus nitratireducens]KAA5537974.1 hypothetical protein FYK55_27925 [Roseiconus nitratireducens]